MKVERGEWDGSGDGDGVKTPEENAVAVSSIGGLAVEENESRAGVGVALALPLNSKDTVAGAEGLCASLSVALTDGDWG